MEDFARRRAAPMFAFCVLPLLSLLCLGVLYLTSCSRLAVVLATQSRSLAVQYVQGHPPDLRRSFPVSAVLCALLFPTIDSPGEVLLQASWYSFPRPPPDMTTSSSAQFVEQPHWSSGIPAQGSPASSTQNQQYAPPIIQQQSQYQTTIPASSSLAPPNLGTTTPSQPGSPAAAGGGSLQGGITKIQQQLNTHGGKYGALLGKELQKQADALKSVPIVAGSSFPSRAFPVADL